MLRRIVFGFVVGTLSATTAFAQAAPAAAAKAAPTARLFASDAGMVLNFIKTDKTADFEMVIAKLKEGLAKSESPMRKQQAQSWRVFKAAEGGPNGSILYVSVIDPVVKGGDYSVVQILNEEFPMEVRALYMTYSDAFVSQNLINLTLLADMKP